ncbi:MAG: hypothetical protein H5T70_05160 [Chloroflexi bacterium]|nr:hypothetical protein [Chloroflexota bacterium]
MGRGLIVCLAACGLVGVAILGWAFRARVGALVVVPILALAPNIFWLSRAIISPDWPSISLGTLGLALVGVSLRKHHRGWLVASGLIFALALYIKATAALAWVPAAWLLWRSTRQGANGRLCWLPWGVWLASLGLPLLGGLLAHDVSAMYAQFVGTQVSSGQMALKIGPHAAKIAAYLRENWGLVALGVAGLTVSIARRRDLAILAGGWLALSIGVLLIRSPMWPSHHLVILLVPLAVAGTVAISAIWAALGERQPTPQSRSAFALGLVALILYAFSLPGTLREDRRLFSAPSWQSCEEAIRFLQERFPAGAVVIGDYQMIPFRAGCSVPPPLATVTKKRIQLGLLTAEQLIHIAETYQPAAILLWDEQLTALPDFVAWVKAHYELAFQWGYHEIYILPGSGAEPMGSTLEVQGVGTP